MAAYTTVNSLLVAAAVLQSATGPDLAALLGDADDNILEIATLSLGAIVATALGTNPWLVALVLPPVLVLHRAVLVRQLKEAASMDAKTGLLNAHTWNARAEDRLRRATRQGSPHAVLVLDLDHFKAVNDQHGHLAGDQVLAAVAGALRAEVRDRDLVGRFGGEEFVILLAGPKGGSEAELAAVADRIRERVARLRVDVATEVGSTPIGGAEHLGRGRPAPRWPGRSRRPAPDRRHRPLLGETGGTQPGAHGARAPRRLTRGHRRPAVAQIMFCSGTGSAG